MPLCLKSHVPVGVQPLVDHARTLLGVFGLCPQASDPDYVDSMLVSLNHCSHTVRAPCHCHSNGVQIHAGRDFGVAAIRTGKGAVRFLFVCMGCDRRAARLYVNGTGEPIPRCRRCLRLRYQTRTTQMLKLERRVAAVIGRPPWSPGGERRRPEPSPLGTPVAPTRDIQRPGAPRTVPVPPARPPAAAGAHPAPNPDVKLPGPPRDFDEVARRFDALFGPGSWQAAAVNDAKSPTSQRSLAR